MRKLIMWRAPSLHPGDGDGDGTLNRSRTVRSYSAARVVLPVVAPRALVAWGLSRLIFAAVQLAGGMTPASFPPPPAAVVLVAGLLGLFDVRMRGERILWANLGAGSGLLFAAYAAAAVLGEAVLALASR